MIVFAYYSGCGVVRPERIVYALGKLVNHYVESCSKEISNADLVLLDGGPVFHEIELTMVNDMKMSIEATENAM